MTLVVADDSIGLPPPPPPARPRVLLIGTGFALAGIVLAFAGLIGLYVGRRAAATRSEPTVVAEGRHDRPDAGERGDGRLGDLSRGRAMGGVLDRQRRPPRAYLALGLTVLLGGAYINGMAFNYTQMGITVHDPVGLLIFTITGMHLAMTGAGMLFVGLMAFRALGGQYSGRDREGIVAAAMYWHVTVIVFAVIWFTIFVTK